MLDSVFDTLLTFGDLFGIIIACIFIVALIWLGIESIKDLKRLRKEQTEKLDREKKLLSLIEKIEKKIKWSDSFSL